MGSFCPTGELQKLYPCFNKAQEILPPSKTEAFNCYGFDQSRSEFGPWSYSLRLGLSLLRCACLPRF